MSLIKSQLIQNITDQNPHLYIKDVERIVNTIFSADCVISNVRINASN